MNPKTCLFAALLTTLASTAPLAAQQMIMEEGAVAILNLPDGRGAIVTPDDDRLTVRAMLGELLSGATVIDLAVGDVLLRVGETKPTDIRSLTQMLSEIETGDIVQLVTRRGTEQLSVQYAKQPDPMRGGAMMVQEDTSGAIAAAVAPQGWVTDASPESSNDFQIAGSHIREQNEGLRVSFRSADPAAATVQLVVGDVICAVNGRATSTLEALRSSYEAIEGGATVTLTVTRDGRETTVSFRKPSA